MKAKYIAVGEALVYAAEGGCMQGTFQSPEELGCAKGSCFLFKVSWL